MPFRSNYLALVAGCVFASFGIVACGVDTFGTMEVADAPATSTPSISPSVTPSPDLPAPAAAPADADAGLASDAPALDAAAADASPLPGPVPPTPGAACPAGMSRCAASNTCVAECARSCPTAPIGCVACTAGNLVAASECVAAATPSACIVLPRVRCTCAGGNAALCPGSQNVCAGTLCLACGEPGSNGLDCKTPADKACDGDPKGKAEEMYTCH